MYILDGSIAYHGSNPPPQKKDKKASLVLGMGLGGNEEELMFYHPHSVFMM